MKNPIITPDSGRPTAARGTDLRCKSWRAEGLLRMLENVLEVGEDPSSLIVYASLGKAARSWPDFTQIVTALTELEENQTLVLQTGRPIGVLNTHPGAPKVVSAVNNTVGNWSSPELFYERYDDGLTMWGGLTAAAWQYIGRQGVLQGTYELFRAVLNQHFAAETAQIKPGALWVLTAGLGGMGSAQPISAAMLGLSSLIAEVDAAKAERQQAAGSVDLITTDLDAALAEIEAGQRENRVRRVVILDNAATVFEQIAARGITPDIVTDQTAAHDARYGYLPQGVALTDWKERREADPEMIERAARESMATQLRAILTMTGRGSIAFENGNNLRTQGALAMSEQEQQQVFTIRGFMEGYLRPLFSRGIGPFRWVLLSGDISDQEIVDDIAASLFPERPEVAEWIAIARKEIPQQGLPARSCWLGHGERSRLALAVNEAVASGKLSAPVLFSRDHLDSAGMTNPRIGTEGMADKSDGVTDWPLLDAMLLATGGADLVAVHSGGGGYSGWMQSAGVSVIADGSELAAQRLRLSLDLDTGLGVLRHAHAGYDGSIATIEAHTGTDTALTWFPPPAAPSSNSSPASSSQ